MYPPTDTPIDPLGLPPAPAAPALPTPAQPKSMNPIAKSVLVALAAMAGPGRGTGILQGLSLADQQAQARAQQQNALAVQDYTRQHQAYQDEQRTYQQQQTQRAAMLKNVLDSFQMELGNTTSDVEAENLYQSAGQLLSAQGFRGFDADSLKRKYKSPDMALRANKAIAKWMANPINKQAFENDPEGIGRITIDVGGAPMTIAQAQTMTGGAAPTAKPKTATPRQPAAVGSFEDYLARTFGENPTSAQILQARKDYNQADDRAPRVTVNAGGAGGSAFPTGVQARIDAKGKEFNGQPIVKRIQTMAEAVSFANAFDPKTTNPADDQALIYAFAKAMDPDSVVREGEYNTVQKYAQSWADTFGFDAKRIFSNTAFLTPQARANMKSTIGAKYQSALPQYRNVRKNYVAQMDRLTGGKGEDWLVDYEGGFASTPSTDPTSSGARDRARELYRQRQGGAK